VLGVDPGSIRTGWGILDGDVDRPRVVACGEIHVPESQAFAVRLHRLQEAFRGVLIEYAPAEAAVESPFHGVSARSALQLAHARGVLLAALACNEVPIHEYAPAAVKKSVCGSGRADKAQVQQMMVRLLGAPSTGPWTPDVSDALALAWCHLAHGRFAAAVSRSRP
jgi:crossover junction endodeoxyribonuclease RuvC